MKFLNMLKKYNDMILKENARLETIYKSMLNEVKSSEDDVYTNIDVDEELEDLENIEEDQLPAEDPINDIDECGVTNDETNDDVVVDETIDNDNILINGDEFFSNAATQVPDDETNEAEHEMKKASRFSDEVASGENLDEAKKKDEEKEDEDSTEGMMEASEFFEDCELEEQADDSKKSEEKPTDMSAEDFFNMGKDTVSEEENEVEKPEMNEEDFFDPVDEDDIEENDLGVHAQSHNLSNGEDHTRRLGNVDEGEEDEKSEDESLKDMKKKETASDDDK